MRLANLALGFLLGAIVFIGASLVIAWTGPTSAPPNGNAATPINVGTTDQIKNAGLGINSLAVFGNAILSGTSRYLNFGSTAGASGYGIRDNAGTMEVKNGGGGWNSLVGTIQNFFATGSTNTVGQIKFADGTTQTTADAGGGITAVTTASCIPTGGVPGVSFPTCTVACPAGFYRTGCSGYSSYNQVSTSAQPSGMDSCYCVAGTGGSTCYAYCAK